MLRTFISYTILFALLLTSIHALSQSNAYDDWIKLMRTEDGPLASGSKEVFTAVEGKSAIEATAVFNEIEKRAPADDNYFKARFYWYKASWFAKSVSTKDSVEPFMKTALNAAYETNNDSLISRVSWEYGYLMYYLGKLEPATMYCLYSAEIDEKNGAYIDADRCRLLGDILYRTRDYEKSIYYTKLAIAKEDTNAAGAKDLIMSRLNTIGICFQRMELYDSALFYFNAALEKAIATKNTIWQSIISGNIGQVYFAQEKYAAAKTLLLQDYQFSKGYGEPASAANSLQWVARINLAENKKDSALINIKEVLQLLQQYPSERGYLQNAYYAAADIYRALGKVDSSYKYSQLYTQLHDSTEKVVANSSLQISQLKTANLDHILTISNLQKDRDKETQQRNFIVIVIIMLSVIAILILNRQKNNLKYKQQLALQEKAAAEAAYASAREQLEMFTQNIVEKTNLIEKLEEQVQDKLANAEQQQVINEIIQQTILTEDDWTRFKFLFEKIYPAFFLKVTEKVPDITIAEQRMAALIRLHLTTRQMASMLGISPDSVYKTRQRLRQRLQLDADASMEEYIAKI